MLGFPGAGPWPEIRKDLDRLGRRPTIAQLRAIEPRLTTDFIQLRISGLKRSAAVLKLFR
jgi:hypothetical protein